MHNTEQLLTNQSDTIRRLQRERDAALTCAAEQRRRAERNEEKLREVRKAHATSLHGDWTDANPAVRELRNDVDWDKLGLALVVRDGKGCVKRAGGGDTNLSLCAWSPDEVLAWVDGYDAARGGASMKINVWCRQELPVQAVDLGTFDVSFVPRVGEWISVYDGWCSEQVLSVTTYLDNGTVEIEIRADHTGEYAAHLKEQA